MGSNSNFRTRGGWWVVAQSVLMLAVILLACIVHGDWHNLPLIAAGGVLFLLGAVAGIAGARALGASRTAFPKPLEDGALVRHGIYGIMRHPLYTSVTSACLGWALIWQSWPSLLAAVALAVLLQVKARREEHWLRERYPEYAEYAQRVRRFIPWIY